MRDMGDLKESGGWNCCAICHERVDKGRVKKIEIRLALPREQRKFKKKKGGAEK
jgi:hypothetical protein